MKKVIVVIAAIIAGVLLLFMILGSIMYFIVLDTIKPLSEEIPDNYVTRVIDGDTFELANQKIVRLICVDAPEKGEEGYIEAKGFLEEMILGKEVRLVKDVSDKDDYERLLRYVYFNKSVNGEEVELFLNYELVKSGYADIYEVLPDTTLCGEIKR